MSFIHIKNLYSDPTFLEKAGPKVYAMEKLDGSSAHVSLTGDKLHFSSGCASHDNFVKLFNPVKLKADLRTATTGNVIINGEAYGGKIQKMASTYGQALRFTAFDVRIDGKWLSVPEAHDLCSKLGIEFVHYELIDNTLAALDAQRDADSVQAIRNGIGSGKMREGIIVRPLIEVYDNDIDFRLITKHKRAEFRETTSIREVDPSKIKVLEESQAISTEWVTEKRLEHVLDKLKAGGLPIDMSSTPKVLDAMLEDVKRESIGEVVWSSESEKAVKTRTRDLFKKYVTAVFKT